MKENRLLAISLLIFSAALLYYGLSARSARKERTPPALSVQAFEGEYGWGYRILQRDSIVVIEQAFIPAVEGLKGFASEEKALKTGRFVLEKIRSGQFPPVVTTDELETLGVL